MTKALLMFSVAACCLAAPQATTDTAGVTVNLYGAPILHRTEVAYPVAALRNGVQGTVMLEVKLDSAGEVSDAHVLGGPEELRKAALQSVLAWHFAQEVAGTTRSIQITFDQSKAAAPAAIARPIAKVQPGTIRSIRAAGLPEQATASLLATLPVREGEEWNAETAQRVKQAVAAFDEHLAVGTTTVSQTPGGIPQLDVMISANPQAIKVGANVIAAQILRKVPPVYPADAKAARIQGVVHLSAIIGADGTIQNVNVLSGPSELTQAAVDAVKQWVYKPTLLNGGPVQVETTIDINYSLSQ